MTSNEIIARSAAKSRLIAREIKSGAETLLTLVTRANIAATALELMAGDLEPPSEPGEPSRSSHSS